MESEWDWKSIKTKFRCYLRKVGNEYEYELWRIWWSICTTRIKN